MNWRLNGGLAYSIKQYFCDGRAGGGGERHHRSDRPVNNPLQLPLRYRYAASWPSRDPSCDRGALGVWTLKGQPTQNEDFSFVFLHSWCRFLIDTLRWRVTEDSDSPHQYIGGLQWPYMQRQNTKKSIQSPLVTFRTAVQFVSERWHSRHVHIPAALKWTNYLTMAPMNTGPVLRVAVELKTGCLQFCIGAIWR